MFFIGKNAGPAGVGPFCTLGHTFQAPEPNGSEEEFFLIFNVFLWFKPRTPWGGLFCSRDQHLTKLGNVTYQMQASEPISSEKEDVLFTLFLNARQGHFGP